MSNSCKSLLRRIMYAVVGGILLNFCMLAVLCACGPDPLEGETITTMTPEYAAGEYHHATTSCWYQVFGTTLVSYGVNMSGGGIDAPSESIGRHDYLASLPGWVGPSTLGQLSTFDDRSHEWIVMGTGWPFIAFSGTFDADVPYENASDWNAHGGLVLKGTDVYWPRLVPLIPSFPGFLMNTFVFAIILMGLYLSFLGAIQLRRLHRGSCPHCGYDLRFDLSRGCSECGWHRGHNSRS